MTRGPLSRVLDNLQRTIGPADSADSDARLMERFITHGDEHAFASLLRRHGPMVYGVCRRVLGNVDDAEDVFQATFLVLVRRARSLRSQASVGSWLYGVAYRTALEARRAMARRRAKEAQAPAPTTPTDQAVLDELRDVLDRELARLPERYRQVIVLCDLQGEGRKDAARRIGCPEGTVASRLAKARTLLASRLTRHGFALSAAALASALAATAASASVPPALMMSTVQAASAGAIAAPVAALVEGVLQAMFMSKLKSATLALLLIAVLGTGIGMVTREVLAAPAPLRPLPDPAPAVHRNPVEPVATATGGGDETPRTRPDFFGQIVSVGNDAKTITLKVGAGVAGGRPQTADITLTAKTKLLFSGVGVGGAKLTRGYWAQVWTVAGKKDTADRISVRGNEGVRSPPSVAGVVVSEPKDVNEPTFDLALRDRGDADKTIEIHITAKSHVVYSNVGKDGACPVNGYQAQVWFKEGSKDTATRASFTGSAITTERGAPEPKPDSAGRVVGVSKDGTVLTLALAPRDRGDEPIKQQIKLSDKTITAYFQVGPNGAEPTEGYMARVWLADGSKDTPGKIIFQGVPKEPPTLRGKVTAIAKDGNSITLESPAKERGAAPESLTVKLTPKTKLTFQNVGPDGALLTEGYVAQVLLADGSTDTAAHVLLSPAPTAAAGERERRE